MKKQIDEEFNKNIDSNMQDIKPNPLIMKNKQWKKQIEEIIKQACIEAQNNKFITPIVFRQSIKLSELFEKVDEEAYADGWRDATKIGIEQVRIVKSEQKVGKEQLQDDGKTLKIFIKDRESNHSH